MTRYLILCIALVITYQGRSQVSVSSLTISTGYDPVADSAVAPGPNGGTPVPDPYWKVSAISTDIITAIAATPIPGLVGVIPGNSANVILPIAGPWVTNPPGQPGSWISCLNANYFTDAQMSSTFYGMTLDRSFKMCSDDNIVLSFHVAADDYITAADIDGTPLAFPSPAPPVAPFNIYVFFTSTLFLTSGIHTIHVSIVNGNMPPSIFDPSNPTGFNMYGTVASSTGKNSLLSENDLNHHKIDSICPGASVVLNTDMEVGNFTWTVSPGGSPLTSLSCTTCIDPVSMPAQTTQYIAVASAGSFCNDTSTVIVLPAPVIRPIDTTVCANDSLLLDLHLVTAVPGSNPRILWSPATYLSSDTISNPVCKPLSSISYLVTVGSDNQCSIVDTVNIVVLIPEAVNFDTVLCTGDSIQLHLPAPVAGGANPVFTWSPGTYLNNDAISNPVCKPLSSITYQVVVSYDQCTVIDTVSVKLVPLPEVNIGPDITACLSHPILLSAGNNYIRYLWSTGSRTDTNTINMMGLYRVTVTDSNNCKASDSMLLTTEPCCNLYLPDAFTPNGDGRNDVFRIISREKQQINDFRIFNRWGQIVFQTVDQEFGWDGNLAGVAQDIGTYFYYLNYQCGASVYEKKGDLTLIR